MEDDEDFQQEGDNSQIRSSRYEDEDSQEEEEEESEGEYSDEDEDEDSFER